MRRLLLVAVVCVVFPAALVSTAEAATNGKIVYGQVFPNYGVTIDPDGSNAHQVGPIDATTCNTWSPAGNQVLCNLWSPDGVPQPATADADGGNFTLLNPSLPLDLFCLNWSPDGLRLLCHSEGLANPADAGLYTVRSSDAGDLVRVTTTLPYGFDNGYRYSPDGSRILYAQYDANEHGTLFSVKRNGSDPIQLSPSRLSVIDLGFFDRVGADWSPDGSHVVFAASSDTRPAGGVFVVNADGSGLRQISPPGLRALSAQWSPDGTRIAFTSCCGTFQAWVVHPNGSGLTEVTAPVRGAVFLTPVWSPDSTKLLVNRVAAKSALLAAFAGGDNPPAALFIVNADGSGLSELADTVSPSQYQWGTAPPG